MFGYVGYQIETTIMTDVTIIAGYSPRTKDQLNQYYASKYRSFMKLRCGKYLPRPTDNDKRRHKVKPKDLSYEVSCLESKACYFSDLIATDDGIKRRKYSRCKYGCLKVLEESMK